MVLAVRGGFQVGQTAKARQGRRVQSLPAGQDHQSWTTYRVAEYPNGPNMKSSEACRQEMDSSSDCGYQTVPDEMFPLTRNQRRDVFSSS